jgi:hypothetical protein
MLEKRAVEYIMGAAMMEPDVRMETNRAGFCGVHFSQMRHQRNRLSLALMLQTHLKESGSKLLTRKKLFEPKNIGAADYCAPASSCFVCEKVNWGMERLMRTFFEFTAAADGKKLLTEQEFVCLPHFDLLRSLAPAYLKGGARDDFLAIINDLTGNYIERLYGDVSHYCNMYDYRNTGKDADWGDSKDSIERAVKFLTAR